LVELAHFPAFRNLSAAGKQLLGQGMTQKEFISGTQLLHKGQAVSGAYFVIQGRLRIYTLSSSGLEATLYSVEPGETCAFALNSLFNDLLYPAWVQAECHSTVAIIPGAVFRNLFQKEPAIRDTLVQSLATMVFGLMAELQQLHSCKLEQRLANLMIARASSDGLLRMTQQKIAQHLGTTREVVARLIQGFVNAKYIETKRGIVVILNTSALTNIATFGEVT
jgi:CRP/FNR family transcriptional regulator